MTDWVSRRLLDERLGADTVNLLFDLINQVVSSRTGAAESTDDSHVCNAGWVRDEDVRAATNEHGDRWCSACGERLLPAKQPDTSATGDAFGLTSEPEEKEVYTIPVAFSVRATGEAEAAKQLVSLLARSIDMNNVGWLLEDWSTPNHPEADGSDPGPRLVWDTRCAYEFPQGAPFNGLRCEKEVGHDHGHRAETPTGEIVIASRPLA